MRYLNDEQVFDEATDPEIVGFVHTIIDEDGEELTDEELDELMA